MYLANQRSTMKKVLLTAILLLGIATSTRSVLGHHGWAWTTGKNTELSGVIKKVRLGNPHGILEVEVRDEMWTIEVG